MDESKSQISDFYILETPSGEYMGMSVRKPKGKFVLGFSSPEKAAKYVKHARLKCRAIRKVGFTDVVKIGKKGYQILIDRPPEGGQAIAVDAKRIAKEYLDKLRRN